MALPKFCLTLLLLVTLPTQASQQDAALLLPTIEGRFIDRAQIDSFEDWNLRLRLSCVFTRVFPFPWKEKCGPDQLILLPVSREGRYRTPALPLLPSRPALGNYQLSVSVEKGPKDAREVLLPLSFEGRSISEARRLLKTFSVYRVAAQPVIITDVEMTEAIRPHFVASVEFLDAGQAGVAGPSEYFLHKSTRELRTRERLLVAAGDLGAAPRARFRSRLLVEPLGFREQRVSAIMPFNGHVPESILRFALLQSSGNNVKALP